MYIIIQSHQQFKTNILQSSTLTAPETGLGYVFLPLQTGSGWDQFVQFVTFFFQEALDELGLRVLIDRTPRQRMVLMCCHV